MTVWFCIVNYPFSSLLSLYFPREYFLYSRGLGYRPYPYDSTSYWLWLLHKTPESSTRVALMEGLKLNMTKTASLLATPCHSSASFVVLVSANAPSLVPFWHLQFYAQTCLGPSHCLCLHCCPSPASSWSDYGYGLPAGFPALQLLIHTMVGYLFKNSKSYRTIAL